MITYVNTVLVGKGQAELAAMTNGEITTQSPAGKFVVVDNTNNSVDSTTADTAERIRIGLVTNKTTTKVTKSNGVVSTSQVPVIKWSNWIHQNAIKSYNAKTYTASTQDQVRIEFSGATVTDLQGQRLVVRLTFKDLPTRFRKWTESYEILVGANDTLANIATKVTNAINKEYKRARVTATQGTYTAASGSTPASFTPSASGTCVKLEAMPYTDDVTADTINVANYVRFSVNMWYTKPEASGFASKNKYSVDGAVITKEPGKIYAGDVKLVRDAEAQAMGYEGILNRGECTWPIIKPDMNVDMTKNYDTITLEFENKYDTADDLKRNTKQTVQLFDVTSTGAYSAIKAILDAFVQGEHSAVVLGTATDEDNA